MPKSKETEVKKPTKRPSAKKAASKTQSKKPAAKKATAKKTAKKPTARELKIQEAIAKKAYELYEHSGRADGRDVEHWLEAEKLLKPKPRKKKTT